MKTFRIKSGKSIYLVKAKDSDEALKKVEEYVSDERLSPMTYAKLKEMGYGHEDWKDLTQEKANEIVAKGKQSSDPKKKEKTQKTETQKQEKSNASSNTISKEDIKNWARNVNHYRYGYVTDIVTETDDGYVFNFKKRDLSYGAGKPDIFTAEEQVQELLPSLQKEFGSERVKAEGDKIILSSDKPVENEKSETEKLLSKSNNKIASIYKGVKVRYNNDDDTEQIKELIDEIQENYGDEDFKKFDFTHGDEYIKIDGKKYTYEDGKLMDYDEDEDDWGGYPSWYYENMK